MTPLWTPPAIADGCCCAGLSSDGYVNVGLVPHGFDIEPQPDYPYEFTEADVRDLLREHLLEEFDAGHFSWPCQEHTTAQHLRKAQGGKSRFGDLLTPGLALIREHFNHKPWIVENVEDRSGKVRAIMAPRPGEHLIVLCGSMFGLEVQRHRLFLANFPLRQPACDHSRFPLDPITGKPRPWGVYHVKGDAIPAGGRTARDEEHGRHVMGSRRLLPWDKLKEGIPARVHIARRGRPPRPSRYAIRSTKRDGGGRMTRLSGEPLRWLEDYQSCLAGEQGPVMLAEAERFLTWAPKPHGWKAWREFRQTVGTTDSADGEVG